VAFSIRAGVAADLPTLVALDDDACGLYAEAGLRLDLPSDHPFAVAERASWRRSLEHGWSFLAVDDARAPVGFAACELVDGAPYLDQLSVRRASMRQGIGRALLARAITWARVHGDCLWLNTYDHLPWNRPFYEREGFVVATSAEWSPGMSAIVADQRRVLPAPDLRVVMRRSFAGYRRPPPPPLQRVGRDLCPIKQSHPAAAAQPPRAFADACRPGPRTQASQRRRPRRQTLLNQEPRLIPSKVGAT